MKQDFKLTFVADIISHHQKPLADELYNLMGDRYKYVVTKEISEDRKKLGWKTIEGVDYVISLLNDEVEAHNAIDEADIILYGNAPYSLIENSLKSRKPVLVYSERIYKNGFSLFKYPVRFLRFFLHYGRYCNCHLLCASAFAPYDYARTLTFINKTYRFGYFTQQREYKDINELIRRKNPHSIAWVARFIDWKHPELPIEIAHRLKTEGVAFHLDMVGVGDNMEKMKELAKSLNVDDYINFLGAVSPEQVRDVMEKSEIFLFSSDHREGWGAVLNEAMNSACAVVANRRIGAVPFLTEHGKNALLYSSCEQAYTYIKQLLECDSDRRTMAKLAYETLTLQWTPQIAAERLLQLCNELAQNGQCDLFSEGVCSRAPIIKG
jgi:glycosyltransferase involved in cell wall biosynthesis